MMNVGNDNCGKVTYMGNLQGPKKENDTCVKTMHVGTMDRGFTVYNYLLYAMQAQPHILQ
jgi:hypothetical protein